MAPGSPPPAEILSAPTFHRVPAARRVAPVGTADRPLPLVIDTDPGLDDAIAIGLALARPELDLLAVTTVAGNTAVEHCTENALRLLHAFGRGDVPVAEGAALALGGEVIRAPGIHGENGLGDTVLPPSPSVARPEGALALTARILRESPEPVAITAIGPLTNIALLLRAHPDLAGRIAHLALMGGSIGEGNWTVSAEFNIRADPEAADIVFRSGVPITMMGLDVTHQAVLDGTSVARLRALGTSSGAIAAELVDFVLGRERVWYGLSHAPIHDPVPVAHLAIPDLVAVAEYNVQVDVGHGPARGRTACDGLPQRLARLGLAPNAQVGIHLDRTHFERILLEAFARLP